MGELFAYGYPKTSEFVHSVAADVSQRPSGYGDWPLSGSCAVWQQGSNPALLRCCCLGSYR